MSPPPPPGGVFRLNTGFDIPYIGLGLFQIRDEEAIRLALDAALKSGYRLFDTAKFYANEREIGRVLKEVLAANNLTREDVFFTTKVRLVVGDNRKNSRQQIEESLELLGFTYLDLVLVHYPRPFFSSADVGDDKDPNNHKYREDAYREMADMQKEGLIRSIGVSNYEIRHLEQLYATDLPKPAVNQLQFHPHMLRTELKAHCEKEGVFFQAFTTLGRHDPRLLTEPALVEVAKKHGVSVQSVLLSWALAHRSGVLPKSQTPSRIAENIRCVDVKLDASDMAALDSLENGNSYSPTRGWDVL